MSLTPSHWLIWLDFQHIPKLLDALDFDTIPKCIGGRALKDDEYWSGGYAKGEQHSSHIAMDEYVEQIFSLESVLPLQIIVGYSPYLVPCLDRLASATL